MQVIAYIINDSCIKTFQNRFFRSYFPFIYCSYMHVGQCFILPLQTLLFFCHIHSYMQIPGKALSFNQQLMIDWHRFVSRLS